MAQRRLTYLAGALVALGWALMTVGAFVRASQSGLGCPDWPACHGRLLAGGHHAMIEEVHRWIATLLIIVRWWR
jgi:cytochrome c oxidase assembly protein subunit 15